MALVAVAFTIGTDAGLCKPRSSSSGSASIPTTTPGTLSSGTETETKTTTDLSTTRPTTDAQTTTTTDSSITISISATEDTTTTALSTTTIAASTTTTTGPSETVCSIVGPRRGVASNVGQFWLPPPEDESYTATVDECKDRCLRMAACLSFYAQGGLCLTLSGTSEQIQWVASEQDQETEWFEKKCVEVTDTSTTEAPTTTTTTGVTTTTATASATTTTPTDTGPGCSIQLVGRGTIDDFSSNIAAFEDLDLDQCLETCFLDVQCNLLYHGFGFCFRYSATATEAGFASSEGENSRVWYGRVCLVDDA
ncbi:Fc.00g056560.m01.CDS01 [Cosmosporella sp. VM-42]